MPDPNDPFKPADATVIRPRPGGARRGPGDSMIGSPRRAIPETLASPIAEPTTGGLNPLVQAAGAVLRLTGQVRSMVSAPDVGGLRTHALDLIREYENRARDAGVPDETIRAGRYALCAGLDEAVLATPWGAQSEWAQKSLLVSLHGETWAGERFFEILERVSADPARHLDLMELQYICLALGFEGRYQLQERGRSQLFEVQQQLYRKIRSHRGPVPTDLSLQWKGIEDRRNRLIRYVPWWVAASAALVIVMGVYLVYYTKLRAASSPVRATLENVGALSGRLRERPASALRLRPLLQSEEARREIDVVEEGAQTTVILTMPNLFASGSAAVNEAARPTLQRVAQALNRVPGDVQVVGHTDVQAPRSLRLDNLALSQARAASVVRILQGDLQDHSRLTSRGMGSEQPRSIPASDPQNWPRNRRVEIVHVAD